MGGAPLPHGVRTAKNVGLLLSGNCCYALYAKPIHAIKIGLASDVLKRWAQIEHRCGMPLQLVMVWKTDDHRNFEKNLFDKFAPYRGFGMVLGRRGIGSAN